MDFKKILEINGEKAKKLMTYCAVVFLIGIMFFLASDILTGIFGTKKSINNKKQVQQTVSNNIESVQSVTSYEDKVKRELINILSQINGVGKVNVMIYFEGSSETQPAYNVNENNKVIQEKDNQGGTRTTNENNKSINVVLLNDGGSTKPLVLKQINPSIGGVIVVAEGAENPHIKETVKNAVRTVLNIPANKVTVEPMKK